MIFLRQLAVAVMLYLMFSPPALSESFSNSPRIVALSPHLTELVFAAGAGYKLVGVGNYSDYPPEAALLPRVSNNGKLNVEAIIRLRPDIVLAWESGNRTEDLNQLRRRGINVVQTEARQLQDVPKLLRQIGSFAETSSVAEAQAADFERKILSLRQRFSTKSEVRTFMEIWHSPLMTINRQHVISSVLDLCGGVNVFGANASLTPTISKEQLFVSRIDAIVSVAFQDDAELREGWRTYRSLSAVRNHHLYAVNAAALSRMTPRLADGAKEICDVLERYRALNALQNGRQNR